MHSHNNLCLINRFQKEYLINLVRNLIKRNIIINNCNNLLTILIIIIINSYTFVTLIRLTHEKLYAMCVEWTKLSEIENYSLSIRLLHAVKTTRLKLCIKFVRVDCMLENECSSHFKLFQKLHFHHHSCCCSEIFRDRDDYSIIWKVNIM